MTIFYQIFIFLYYIAIKVASIFNPKAKLWVNGRTDVFEKLKAINFDDNIYWFHCASLGELEQGKPIIEKLKEKDSTIKILITIFSPSGYEFAKSYNKADFVFYLPLDTRNNAKRFIEIVNPSKAFFIKYEFWYCYLNELSNNNIPTYLISGVFRKNQLFFKWYGSLYREMLNYFTHFFVQNEKSKILLNNLGFHNVTTTGDTRLDRVYENSLKPEKPALVKKFIENKKVIILGSSWLAEEKIIAEFIQSTKKDFKFIFAPHNIDTKHIRIIENLLENNYIKYSDATYENVASYNTLIIDNIGILANTYQFTDIAFVGGGFSGSLHNILEPASFGNVILFGPKHEKFHEAEELININGAYQIKDADDLLAIINHLETNNNLELFQGINKNYIETGRGATEKIIFKINT
ncbi:MAG: 3-deoxy-D-manno-octulosonic acid transferase [Flavobacteriales bacterium]|nr:MAG: 3-deoxy-D-manno-octulosonic acid transferase [Flavobacteriales bacterium]